MDYLRLLEATAPDLIVVVSLFTILGIDYGLLRNKDALERNRTAASLSTLGLALAFAVTVWQLRGRMDLNLGDGQLVLNSLTLSFKALLFVLAAVVVQFSAGNPVNRHLGEYYAMLLLCTLGMGFLITTENILMAFVALELISLSLYALTAFRKSSLVAAEAAIKYFTFGGLSSAFLLFGLSYLYGATGSLHIDALATAEATPLLLLALLFIFVGLGFKVAVVPFHLWAPDVYQCAPTPVAGWVATGSKIASAFLLIRILHPVAANPDLHQATLSAFSAIAVVSMLIGNLGALRQTNLKRLLAYSGIANMGYLLVGAIALSTAGMASSLFYLVVYSLANLGAFGVVAVLTDHLGREARIDDFKGCWKRSPSLACAFLVFFLSLAGIPPLAGFVGKYYLFFAAIEKGSALGFGVGDGYYLLVAFALLMSVVSLYYYVKVLKAFLVVNDEPGLAGPNLGVGAKVGLFALAFAVIALGLFPEPVMEFIRLAVIR